VAALVPGNGASAQGLIDAADAALYRAKNSGRGRAVLHQIPMAPTMTLLAA
jgi:PleD family two-component response regulator